ncbi:MAG: site-2 protease family protein [Candidatus Methanoperedens sp.]|nr:site-2 protease family protein [Candidatus Methanoperedens sp.]MCZ7370878.1 site-2 protease family protein [Candidatus Methanoperedens sp.]
MSTLDIILVIFFLYWLFVALLDRRGILSKYNISAYGPILMIRTQKGQIFLDKLAVPKRFWRLFANIGLPAMLMGMLVMLLMILFVDYSMIRSFQTHTVPPPSKFNEPRNIFLIPGVNEFIPLWYGIIALLVTLVVHEFSHAILCKVEGIKVKSMGILLAVLPIGGFAEPDEEQLLGSKEEKGGTQEEAGIEPKKLATRSERVRVLTAGVMANFVTAFIAFILFFSILGSLAPVGDVMITGVVPGYPAEQAGVRQNMILAGIDDKQISTANDFLAYAKTLKPGSNVSLNLVDGGVRKEIKLVSASGNETSEGVVVFKVVEGSPAEAAGIKSGMVLVKIGEADINSIDDFITFMNSTSAGEKLDIYLMSNSSVNASRLVFRNVELVKYPYEKEAKKGFLGVSYAPQESATSYSVGITIGQFPAKNYLLVLKSIPSLLTGFSGWILLFSLPIFGLTGEGFPGFSGLITHFYEPAGWAIPLGTNIFWILNILMWIGWMNFYVGLFNCLPAVPLDGGHVFRDVLTSSLSRIVGNGEKVERISNAIAVLFAVLILISLVFVTLAPYAAQSF